MYDLFFSPIGLKYLPENTEFRNVRNIAVGEVFRNSKGLSDRRPRLLSHMMFRDSPQSVQTFLLLDCQHKRGGQVSVNAHFCCWDIWITL